MWSSDVLSCCLSLFTSKVSLYTLSNLACKIALSKKNSSIWYHDNTVTWFHILHIFPMNTGKKNDNGLRWSRVFQKTAFPLYGLFFPSGFISQYSLHYTSFSIMALTATSIWAPVKLPQNAIFNRISDCMHAFSRWTEVRLKQLIVSRKEVMSASVLL